MLIVRNEVSRPARTNGIELPAEKGPDGRIIGVPDRVYSVASWHGPRQPAIEKRSRTSTFRGVVIWALPRGRRETFRAPQFAGCPSLLVISHFVAASRPALPYDTRSSGRHVHELDATALNYASRAARPGAAPVCFAAMGNLPEIASEHVDHEPYPQPGSIRPGCPLARSVLPFL